MKWYFALNGASLASDDLYARCAEAAVLSALQNTSLEPHFVFDGGECELTRRLRRLGTRIVFHRTSLYEAIVRAKPDDPGWRRIAQGAFLRIDLPDIDTESQYVLYTDCDVLFFKEPDLSRIRPETLAVAPEFTIGDYDNMNSGVMLMNLPAMRREAIALRAFLISGIGEFVAFDQGALRIFYKGRYGRLPETMNWKPYWGSNDRIEILHFHGPKPPHVRAMQSGATLPRVLHDLYDRDRTFYESSVTLWEKYVARAARM